MDLDEKIRQSKQILKDLRYPEDIIDDKAALLFLALNGQKIESNWGESQKIRKSVNDLLNFIERVYNLDFRYLKNSIKKVKFYPLLDFGIAKNIVFEMEPIVERPMVIQLREEAFDVVRYFGTSEYSTHLQVFLDKQPIFKNEFKDTLVKYLKLKEEGIIDGLKR
ncbi:hypothetical protein LFX15_18470 [Leptospira levettii]|uniref:hypothetical protein n=1 Tax=Leptospira levettii TaxID=2023178 RepID=UPI0023AAE11B|nr:hypothetical protein [Leptospira levettii]MCG6150289.1 hypothetical protein [Leptospira levettii]